jgi:uncharacterized protein (TIGR02444 family)
MTTRERFTAIDMNDLDAKARRDSPFWRFSVNFYSVPDVAGACLALQDKAGADVNIVMFLLWNATENRTFSAEAIADVESRIGVWRDLIVVPLRTVRRALKSPPAAVDSALAEKYRTKIKGVELEAEKLQQEALYALAPSLKLVRVSSPAAAARASISAYQDLCPDAFPTEAVETLLAAFARSTR